MSTSPRSPDALVERLLPAALPAVTVLLLLVVGTPFASPDGIEMAVAGRCWWTALAACPGTEPWYWPPLFPALAGLLALVLDPAVAALLLSLLGAGLLTLAGWHLARRTAGPHAAALAPLLLLTVAPLRDQALSGEARTLGLAAVLGAAAFIADARRPTARARVARDVAAGACALAAMLLRPELTAAVGLLVPWALWRHRLGGVRTALIAGLPMLPYVAVLSSKGGALMPTSRGWQGRVFGLADRVPADQLKLEVAAGSWGTPLRAAFSTTDVPAAWSPDPVGAVSWLLEASWQSLPLPVLVLAAVGLLFGGRARVPALLVALPAVATAAMPGARDPVLPGNSVATLLVAAPLLAAAGAAGLGHWLSLPRSAPAAAGLFAVSLALATPRPPQAIIREPRVFGPAIAWLQAEHPDATVAATIQTAAVPLRAGNRRHRLPSAGTAPHWADSPERPDLVLLSNTDLPAAAPTMVTLRDQLRPVARWESHGDWLVVLAWR